MERVGSGGVAMIRESGSCGPHRAEGAAVWTSERGALRGRDSQSSIEHLRWTAPSSSDDVQEGWSGQGEGSQRGGHRLGLGGGSYLDGAF